jgi:hypothetical protein
MKKIIFIILLVLVSCSSKEYKYEIHGQVSNSKTGNNLTHNAIWYTNNISFDGDTIFYINSDGSEVRIKPPYKLIKKSLNKK